LNASANVPGTFAYTPAAGTLLHAGAGQTLTVVFTPNDLAGYVPVTNTVSLNVTRAPLVVTAGSTNKIYGAALPSFTVGYSGFVNSETVAALTTPASLTTTATATSPAGTYAIVPGGVVASNYTFAYVNGTLTINAASTVASVVSSLNPARP